MIFREAYPHTLPVRGEIFSPPKDAMMTSIYDKKEFKHCSTSHCLAFLLVMLLVLTGFPAIAETKEAKKVEYEKPWSAELHVKRYFGSHTSYEFGNPYAPYQAPLSRLEFPLNTWWSGGELRHRFSRISVGLEVLKNVSMESDGSFEDSDWDDDANPNVKTVYSESECRMEPSYMVRGDADLKVADWLGLPVWFDLRPVAGIRWQRFELVAHDGVQTLPSPPITFSGDALRFTQTYWQYFLGIRAAYDLGKQTGTLPLKLLCQLDWAYVDGDNSDHHLLRAGNRWTYEKTSGEAWHATLCFKAALTRNINAGVEAEYLRIQTTGSHRWVNDVYATDMSWDNGVKVWSEQKSIMLSLEYLF